MKPKKKMTSLMAALNKVNRERDQVMEDFDKAKIIPKRRPLTHTEVMQRIHLDAARSLCLKVKPGNGITLPPQGEDKGDDQG